MDIEEKAKKMGWLPQDEFKGDPDNWRSADEFVQRAENMVGIQKERLENALGKIDALERTIKEQKQTFEKFQEFSSKAEERAFKRAETEYKNKLQGLKAELKAAAKSEDWDRYDSIERNIDNLEKPEAPQKIETKQPSGDNGDPNADPVFVDWKQANKWYGEDFELTALADSLGQFVKTTKPHLVGTRGFYDEVANQIRQYRADKFENPNRTKPPATEGAGEPDVKPGKKSFSDLPAEAKKEYEQFKTIMPNYTKEEYAKAYWEEA